MQEAKGGLLHGCCAFSSSHHAAVVGWDLVLATPRFIWHPSTWHMGAVFLGEAQVMGLRESAASWAGQGQDSCSREVLKSWGGSGTPSQPLIHLAVGKSARGFDAAFGECPVSALRSCSSSLPSDGGLVSPPCVSVLYKCACSTSLHTIPVGGLSC